MGESMWLKLMICCRVRGNIYTCPVFVYCFFFQNWPRFAVSGARRSFQMNGPIAAFIWGSCMAAHAAANLRIRRCGKKLFSGEIAVPASSYRRKEKHCTPVFWGGKVAQKKTLTSSVSGVNIADTSLIFVRCPGLVRYII